MQNVVSVQIQKTLHNLPNVPVHDLVAGNKPTKYALLVVDSPLPMRIIVPMQVTPAIHTQSNHVQPNWDSLLQDDEKQNTPIQSTVESGLDMNSHGSLPLN